MLVRCFNFAHGEKEMVAKWAKDAQKKTQRCKRLAIYCFFFLSFFSKDKCDKMHMMAQREISKMGSDLKIERLSLRKRV